MPIYIKHQLALYFLIYSCIVIITGCSESVVNPVYELSSKYQLCFLKVINNNWEVCLYSANTGDD